VKASEAQIRARLDKPGADIRLFLLYGPDEAGANDLAARLGRAMGPDAERIDYLFWAHDRHDGNPDAMRTYLGWEEQLPGQVAAEGGAGFRLVV